MFSFGKNSLVKAIINALVITAILPEIEKWGWVRLKVDIIVFISIIKRLQHHILL